MTRTCRVLAGAVVSALVVVLGVVVSAGPTQAAEQNGYVFNDAWGLTGSNQRTQYSSGDPVHYGARTQLPSRLGGVDVTATFTENSQRNAGTSFLTNGTNQSAYGGQAGMFVGNPTPGDLPALGLQTMATMGYYHIAS